MEYYVDSRTMKQIDSDTIEHIGIPSMVLMERAALSVVKNITNNEDKSKRIIAVCGIGNNGGDGICIVRILHELGFDASVYIVGNIEKCSIETRRQLDIACNCGVKVIENNNKIDFLEYDIIIDAIFGIGLCREIEGIIYDIIERINTYKKIVYSVDIPSGVSADTGQVLGIAIEATYTITFGLNKKGCILYPGRMYAGKVFVEDIGFPNIFKKDENVINSAFMAYTKDNYKSYIPLRKKDSNKGTYGKVLVVAGSNNMAGACYFSAKAAYRMGTGIVQIYTCEENREILQQLIPEAIMSTYSKLLDNDNNILDKEKEVLDKALAWCDVVVVGPGLGTNKTSIEIVKYVINNCNKTKIIDADALNILTSLDIKVDNIILTPHLKEMSRIIKEDISNIKKMMHNPRNLYNKIDFIEQLDNENNVLVLKDATSIIFNNNSTFVNTSGNNGLATAGSGDVLTGIIAGLVAQGLDNFYGASLGCYIHGIAAEYYTKKANCYSLMASDIMDSLQYIWRETT